MGLLVTVTGRSDIGQGRVLVDISFVPSPMLAHPPHRTLLLDQVISDRLRRTPFLNQVSMPPYCLGLRLCVVRLKEH